MKTSNFIWAAMAACLLSGCASIGMPPTGDCDSKAVLSVPDSMLDPTATPIRWSYWNKSSPQKRIRVSLSGVSVYKTWVGSTPWNPRYFVDTRLSPGAYSITVEDLDLKKSATTEFEASDTDQIHLELVDPPEIWVNTNGYFNFI